MSSEMLRRFDS